MVFGVVAREILWELFHSQAVEKGMNLYDLAMPNIGLVEHEIK